MHKEILALSIVLIALFAAGFMKNSAYAADGTGEVQILMDKAEKYMAANDYQEAKRAYMKAIAIDSKNISARNNLGAMYVVIGDYDKALEQFEEVLKLNPDYRNAYENIGLIMSRKGDYNRASVIIKKALTLNPDSPTAHYNLGLCYIGLEKYKDGIKELKSAVELNPNFSEAFAALGDAYYRLDSVSEAADNTNRAISANPSNYSAHNTLGLINLRQGKFEAALDSFKTALKGPRNVQVMANYNIALAYISKKNAAQAIEYLKKAADLEPGFAPALNDWGMLTLQGGNVDEAAKLFTRAITIDQQNRTYNFNLIECYRIQKKFDEAIELGEYLLKVYPKNAQVLDSIGLMNYEKGDLKKAKGYFEKSIAADPTFAEPHYHLGLIYDKSNLSDKAIGEYQVAVKLNPNHSMALNNLGFDLMNGLKLDEAAVHLENALKLEPNFSFALYNLGIVYFNRKKGNDVSNAKNLFMKILEVEPKNSQLYKLAQDAIAQVDAKK